MKDSERCSEATLTPAAAVPFSLYSAHMAQAQPGNDRVILTTRRLLLRPAYKQDATNLHEAFSDPDVMRYWSEPPHTSVEQTRTWVDKMIASPANGVTDFVICRVTTPPGQAQQSSSSSPVIGKIGVWHTANAEIGFLIDKKYWRQGLASEALSILLPYLFNQKGFQTITADIDPRNDASQSILEKFGFEITGTQKNSMKIGDNWVDSTYLKLTRERFRQKAA